MGLCLVFNELIAYTDCKEINAADLHLQISIINRGLPILSFQINVIFEHVLIREIKSS